MNILGFNKLRLKKKIEKEFNEAIQSVLKEPYVASNPLMAGLVVQSTIANLSNSFKNMDLREVDMTKSELDNLVNKVTSDMLNKYLETR